MSQATDEMRQSLNEGLTELEKLADEIRVRVHLAGMDAKDAWSKQLEPRLDEARQHVREATESSKKSLQDIVKSFQDFRKTL